MRRAALIALCWLASSGALSAQSREPLSLGVSEAMARARSSHPDLARIQAERRGREADARGSLATYLPRISTDWSLVRTDDPVAVFGAKLRQGVFAAGDLALDALNHPSAVGNSGVTLTVEQPLVAPEGWAGRKAALSGAEAGRLMEARAIQLVAFDALQTYFGAVVATARIGVLDSALTAARQTLGQVQSLRREGVVTGVDEQLAVARVSELEANRAMAEADRLGAVDRLLLALGEPPGRPVVLLDSIDLPVVAPDSGVRFDLAALERVVGARDADRARIRAQWLPNVGAFGSLAWNQGSFGAFGGPRHWNAGLVVRWTPFRGFQDVAQAARATAERDRAVADLAAQERAASAEVRAAAARYRASLAAVAAADRALESAAQASRIATTRYQGGVATISELLNVRAAESSQRLARLDALFQARIAVAQLALARGGDPR